MGLLPVEQLGPGGLKDSRIPILGQNQRLSFRISALTFSKNIFFPKKLI